MARDPFHNPFASLAGKLGELPPGERPAPVSADPPRGPARAVVRMERKGRRGKEVTVVEQLGLQSRELETWGRELKNALGCGGTVEDRTIVVQGDQRERVKVWLEKKGVRRVSVG